MISKFVILALIGYCLAKKAEIDISEGGENFKESIETDEAEGVEIIKTPRHGSRSAVVVLVHYKAGLVAAKIEKDERCVIRKLDKEVDESPGALESGLKKTGGKFPYHHVEEINNMILTIDFANPEKLPRRIRKFCKGHTIVKGIVDNKSMKGIEKDALKLAKDAKKDARKRAIVREFVACTNASTMKIMTCDQSKLYCSCRIRKPWCTYYIKCPLGKTGFDCKGLHKMESMVCCDYNC